MKNLLTLAIFLIANAAQAGLPVRFEGGGETFTPSSEVLVQRNLRTLSTPPYTLKLQGADIMAFANFTAGLVGYKMNVYVCDEEMFSPVVQVASTDGLIYIHAAMAAGRLDTFESQGCP